MEPLLKMSEQANNNENQEEIQSGKEVEFCEGIQSNVVHNFYLNLAVFDDGRSEFLYPIKNSPLMPFGSQLFRMNLLVLV